LLKKLEEEACELAQAKDDKQELIKEIGDVLEALDAIMEYYQIDEEAVKTLKNDRFVKRGGFKKRIFLESVEELI
jgi:predicted house-cleaning noncanonical NTP pyrophosphatase (MazG superfamily)